MEWRDAIRVRRIQIMSWR